MSTQSTMAKVTVTDDEIVVDSMLLASRGEKENPALPSYGRSLVPYFCPNRSANPTEDDINVATDLDTYRREGASILDIPPPEASNLPTSQAQQLNAVLSEDLGKNFKKTARLGNMHQSEPLKLRKRGAGGRNRKGSPPKSEEVCSPTSPLDNPPVLTTSSDSDATDSDSQQRVGTVVPGQGPTWQQAELQKSPFRTKRRAAKQSKGEGAPPLSAAQTAPQHSQQSKQTPAISSRSQVPSAPMQVPQPSLEIRSQLPERFAGAAFHNSPAPSCLPLPTFAYQKVQDSSAPARLNLFSSPPREPRAPATANAGLLTPPRVLPLRGGARSSDFAPLVRTPSSPEQLFNGLGPQSGRDGAHLTAEQATLKLQELLKLGTPSPAPAPRGLPQPPMETSESSIATRNLRRMLQLA